MSFYVAAGATTYISTFNSTGTSINSTQRVISARFFNRSTDDSTAHFSLNGGSAVKVRSGFGFDWSPGGKWVGTVFEFSPTIDFFAEIENVTAW